MGPLGPYVGAHQGAKYAYVIYERFPSSVASISETCGLLIWAGLFEKIRSQNMPKLNVFEGRCLFKLA